MLEREAVRRYLDQLESVDGQDEVVIDSSAVAAALEKLKQDAEPEARLMRMAHGNPAPAYNVQTAVDAEHGIIVAHEVTTEATDNRSLLPMSVAAKQALEAETLNVVADAGYSNGEQAECCEQQGIVPHAPANRGVNNQGNGELFDRSLFIYDETTDTFRCPADKTLTRKQVLKHKKMVQYAASPADCSQCSLRSRCTTAERRFLKRHLHEAALQRMNARATPKTMRLRKCTVERPFAMLKYVIFGHPRLLLRGLAGAQTEISLATLVYNLKTMISVLGTTKIKTALA